VSTPSPSYWLLDARTGWRTLAGANVSTSTVIVLDGADGGGYLTGGTWWSTALDGALPGCQWHRIDLALAGLPAGATLELATFTADDPDTPVQQLPADAWSPVPRLVGAAPRPGARPDRTEDLMIQSPPGRYLWVRLGLTGDGYGTPSVRRLVVHYPRDSYLRYLPAVFSASDAGRSFLERFLSIPQTEWDDLRRRIVTSARYFDPRAVPEGPALRYLGDWLDARYEPEWTADDQRRLLCLLPTLRGRRGTAGAVRALGRVYLRSIAGPAVDRYAYPYLSEGFRERDWLTVNQARLSERRLWGAGVVARLQLGGTARAGVSRLVSIGDPSTDMFAVDAHRVRALVPAGWIRTAGEQRLLERGLRIELPAHARAELTLLRPCFQLGAQATLGIDTVAGPRPTMRLASAADAATTADSAPAPALPPRGRLGYDTVLANAPRERTKGDQP
jgi:phage tail-like protein